MAKPTTAAATKLIILLGNGASPEVFAAPCGLVSKGISFAAASGETTVPDCDNPDAPAWVERVVQSLSATVTGEGVLAFESLEIWNAWFFSGLAKTCRIKLDLPGAVGGGYFFAPFILSQFQINGQNGQKVQVSVQLQNDGQVQWVDAA
ncbi:phage tail tube protein [Blastochloris tepida]|uniref:Phage tail protein n=1 Tax=Blastochloris tepida TaxID=2233851 RepID=A0A348G1E8_9HYPH|nr:phage tail tube protein [Blastochloris tepida]BBF93381.1 hypothetical protein BLTE_20660 [Blastochloris tepida]